MSAELVNRLEMAREASKRTRLELNAIARQEVPQPGNGYVANLRRARQLLREMHDDLGVERVRVVKEAEHEAEREALPKPLREAYEALYLRTYGTNGAVSVGDANVIRGIGKRETRTSSSQPEGRGGSAQPSTKKFGQSRRSVIVDQKAYGIKINYDRKLRRLAKEIMEDLAGAEADTRINVCTRCARIGEEGWRFCPNCGSTMEVQER
jgi:hypothetical protein